MNIPIEKTKSNNMIFSRSIKNLIIAILVILLITAIVFPLGELLFRAFRDNNDNFVGITNFKSYFSNKNLSISLNNSIYIATMTTLISVVLGFFYAYGLVRSNIYFKKQFRYIAMLPLFVPTLMFGISLVYLLGNKGLISNNLLGIQFPLYGSFGIILAEVIYVFPQVLLIFIVALSMTDYRLYEAAETLNTSKLKKFIYITLPSIKYELISSVMVSFVMSFTDFGAPKILGGNYTVLATDVYQKVIGQQDMAMGGTIGIILLIPALIAFIVDRKFLSNKNGGSFSAKSKNYVVKENKRRDYLYFVYCLLISGFILMLFIVGFLASIINVWPYDMSFTFSRFNWNSGIENGFDTYINSILISLLSGVFGTVFAYSLAYFSEKGKLPKYIENTIYGISILPLAIPGLVIGLSYIFFFNRVSYTIPFLDMEIMNPFNSLYGTVWILIIANIIHFLSVPFLTTTTSLKKLDKEYEMVGDSMGVPWYKVFFTLTIPMTFDSILEIFIYYFVNSMVTVSAVIFLYTPYTKLAAISVVNMDDSGDTAAAIALIMLILLTNVIVKLVFDLFTKKIRKKMNLWKTG